MRNPQIILDTLYSHSKDSNYTFERLYRILFNEDIYHYAYQRLGNKAGNLTAGTDGDTINGMNIQKIRYVIECLKNETYQPYPARRTYIPKKNGKLRPLGIPAWIDKLVQEVIRMILQAIYEGTFSDRSHGFRPYKSCHTALTQIQKTFTGAKWFIEGDIKGFFDNIDHDVLIGTLRKRISDERFLRLIRKFLNAGYVEDWTFHESVTGTPQGGIISPILANIYLDNLDRYMAEYAAKFDKGNCRKINPAYYRLNNKLNWARGRFRKETDECKRTALQEKISSLQAEMRRTEHGLPTDENYRRIVYTRYADDFLIGVIGTKIECETIKADITNFMRDILHLELSPEKTLITHGKDIAKFLGFDITVRSSEVMQRNAKGILQRNHKGKVQLLVSADHVKKALEKHDAVRYKIENGKTVWKSKARGKLFSKKPHEILMQVNSEIRGFYNYYCIANNSSWWCAKYAYIMEYSLCHTLAQKLNLSVSKVKGKYQHNGVFTIHYNGKDGKHHNVTLYHDGFARITKKRNESDTVGEVLPHPALSERLRKGKCELCGKEGALLMYHARAMKNLSERTLWGKKMLEINRKSLAVCSDCFTKIIKAK